jgi:hypothetical protein
VSTKPTPAGNDVLDPFHPYGLTKHLHEKPVSRAITLTGRMKAEQGLTVPWQYQMKSIVSAQCASHSRQHGRLASVASLGCWG